MQIQNLPVPAGPRAPVSPRWLWYVGPPALITWLYRTVFPPRVRRLWNLHGGATSHLALAAILAGWGWHAFWYFAWPFSGPQMGWKEDYGRSSIRLPYWSPQYGADDPSWPFSWFPNQQGVNEPPWPPTIPAKMLQPPRKWEKPPRRFP